MGFKDEYLKGFNIFLGSKSPRREQLLHGLGIKFKTWTKEEIDETFKEDMNPIEVATSLAKRKSEPYEYDLSKNDILITADTIVAIDDRILMKPDTREIAIKILEDLSAREHRVITGVCLNSTDKCHCFYSETLVKFAQLERDEIIYYVDYCAPYDKAGAYGIQEWIGYIGVEFIKGSYFNVMGLPVKKLYHELKIFTGYNSK